MLPPSPPYGDGDIKVAGRGQVTSKTLSTPALTARVMKPNGSAATWGPLIFKTGSRTSSFNSLS